MKPWAATTIRVILIIVVGLIGLTSLLASACGLLISSTGTHGILVPVLGGFVFAALCVGIVYWVSVTTHRGLQIALGVSVACLAILWWILHRGAHPP